VYSVKYKNTFVAKTYPQNPGTRKKAKCTFPDTTHTHYKQSRVTTIKDQNSQNKPQYAKLNLASILMLKMKTYPAARRLAEMRSLRRNRRGQVRVIEAFFASVLMLSVLSMIPMLQHLASGSDGVGSSTALRVLSNLDGDGHLARLIDQRNWSALQSCVKALVSPAMWFNLTVFDENMTQVNSAPICNGGPISDRIEAADYICASTGRTYAVYDVRLQLSGPD
jgi:hypothetical protein